MQAEFDVFDSLLGLQKRCKRRVTLSLGVVLDHVQLAMHVSAVAS